MPLKVFKTKEISSSRIYMEEGIQAPSVIHMLSTKVSQAIGKVTVDSSITFHFQAGQDLYLLKPLTHSRFSHHRPAEGVTIQTKLLERMILLSVA